MTDLVVKVISNYMAEHDVPQKPVLPESAIMGDLGLDSLALAVIVLELEEETGKDPFEDGFITSIDGIGNEEYRFPKELDYSGCSEGDSILRHHLLPRQSDLLAAYRKAGR